MIRYVYFQGGNIYIRQVPYWFFTIQHEKFQVIMNATTNTTIITFEKWTTLWISNYVIVFVMVIMILGILGNLHTILVYWFYYKKNKLRNFVLTLSIVDLWACSLMHPYYIFRLSKAFHLGVVLCEIHYFVVNLLIMYSYGLLTIISIDRFRMIIYPFGKQLSYSQSKVLCIGCGFFIFVFCVPQIFNYSYSGKEIYSLETNSTSKVHQCNVNNDLFEKISTWIILSYLAGCFVVCLVLYVKLLVFLWIKSKTVSVKIGDQLRSFRCCSRTNYAPNTPSTSTNDNNKTNTRRKTFVKGMRTSFVFLVVTFVSFLCLLSNVVVSADMVALRQIVHEWVYFLAVMHLMNSTVNPIIYHIHV